jgi:hypothetical protein
MNSKFKIMKPVLITLIIVFLIIKNSKLPKETFLSKNLNFKYDDFEKKIKSLPRKKNILIFTSGPTLKKFKKKDIPDYIWEDSYVIAVKSSINFINSINIKPDILVSNFYGSYANMNKKLLKTDIVKVAIMNKSVAENDKFKYSFDHYVDINPKRNIMEDIIDNKVNSLKFSNINNKTYTSLGHIMMELAIPICVMLNPENIITIGWDLGEGYWDEKNKIESFEDWSKWSNNEKILNFTKYLPSYLKKHHNINIYKISPISLPYLDVFTKK